MAAERLIVQAADGVPLSVLQDGSGPTLILVHGSAATSAAWTAVRPVLSREFTVWAMDRRGRGASGDGLHYSLDAEAHDLAAVARAAGKAVTLVAHSYGALVAVIAAAGQQLQNVTRLILYEPPAYVTPPPYQAQVREAMNRAWAANDPDGVASAFLGGVLGLSEEILSAVRTLPVWDEITAMAGTVYRESKEVDAFRIPAGLSAWRTPTTVLLGSQSPAWMSSAAREVCAAIRCCRIEMLEGQGHLALQTAPALFASKVLEIAARR